ncbi:MAG TPA: hypothetical protein VKH63_23235 [Candidatus Acidoferrum sp.]|jgi:hypothetical protein|nr:hypothetical protein [Candidatus Acidoferrum sp.]
MTNERYLIASYFACAAIAVGLGAIAYLFLRRPFDGVADAASGKRLSSMLKRLLPWGLLLPALLGFVSVSYQGCNRTTYQEIIQNRSYLVEKNQEQISSILFYILVAIVFWDAIVLLILKYAQNGRDESQIPQVED